MIPELTDEDLKAHEYTIIRQRMNSTRFNLEQRIDKYVRKSDAFKIQQSLKDFLLVQASLVDKIGKTHAGYAVELATLCGATVGRTTLNYDEEETVSFFHTKKIDYRKDFPFPVNDALELYVLSLDIHRNSKCLEAVTDAFFAWMQETTAGTIASQPEFSSLPSFTFKVDEKSYTAPLSSFVKEKKPSINVHKYIKSPETKPAENQANPGLSDYIYGHDEVKREFSKITTVVKHLDYFSRLFDRKKLFQNYLLVGPPGTGKTTLISSLAERCGLVFMNIPCVELGSEYFSKMASNIHAVYDTGRRLLEQEKKPGVIIFFDEFDHIAKRRGYGNSPENDSLITTLNENLDGGSSRAGIITFAATNVEEIIDPAITSRFHKLYVGYPTTNEGVIGIHRAIITKMETYAHCTLFKDIDYTQIFPFSRRDERYKSGRVIEHILYGAALQGALQHVQQHGEMKTLPLITTEQLHKAYENYHLDEVHLQNALQNKVKLA